MTLKIKKYWFSAFHENLSIRITRLARFVLRLIKDMIQETLIRLGLIGCNPKNLDHYLVDSLSKKQASELLKDKLRKHFHFNIEKREIILNALKKIAPKATGWIIADADLICHHVFDLLGSGPTHLAEKIDWHSDFKTGHRWNPKTYYKHIRPAPYPGGYDIKVPWELSRFQHFVRLGQAYWITNEDKYAFEFVAQVEDWIESNPWPFGVNWACTMDVAIRVVNWLWGLTFFLDSPILTEAFLLKFTYALFLHGQHIYRNLEKKSNFTNNHYIADLVGLVYLGILCPQFKEAAEWLELGLSELWHEMFKQVSADGVSFEGSIAYHRLATELFISPIILCSLNGIPLPDQVMKRLEKMVEFVMDYTKPDDMVPLIGDADNGRLYRLKKWDPPEREWLDHRYLLAIGAVLFNRRDFMQSAGDQWEEAIWLCPSMTLKLMEFIPKKCHYPYDTTSDFNYKIYSQGGFSIVRNNRMYLIMRDGNVTNGKFGAHIHNDALSFEWFVDGMTVIRDSGTGGYTQDYNLRYKQRSVRSHSAFCIDSYEPYTISALQPFLLSGRSCIDEKIRVLPINNTILGKLKINGFEDSSNDLTLSREIRIEQKGIQLHITDKVEGVGRHTLERFFILGDAQNINISKNIVSCNFDKGKLKIKFLRPKEAAVRIDENLFSYSFGKFLKGHVINISQSIVLPFFSVTNLLFISN